MQRSDSHLQINFCISRRRCNDVPETGAMKVHLCMVLFKWQQCQHEQHTSLSTDFRSCELDALDAAGFNLTAAMEKLLI